MLLHKFYNNWSFNLLQLQGGDRGRILDRFLLLRWQPIGLDELKWLHLRHLIVLCNCNCKNMRFKFKPSTHVQQCLSRADSDSCQLAPHACLIVQLTHTQSFSSSGRIDNCSCALIDYLIVQTTRTSHS